MKWLSSPGHGSKRLNFFTCSRAKLCNLSLNALMRWPEIAFQAGHQEKSYLVGYNSASPKWVPGALRGDKQINAKCHFRMIKTQEVTSASAFTHTLGADGQKQAIQGNMHISSLCRRKASQPNTDFSAEKKKKKKISPPH